MRKLVISLFVIGVVLEFIVGAIKALLSKQKIRFNQNVVKTDLATIKEIDYSVFNNITEKFEGEGFVKSGDYVVEEGFSKIYIRVLKNITEGIIADVSHLETRRLKQLIITLKSEYRDEFRVETTTKIEPPIFKCKNLIVYRHLTNTAEEILEKHRKHIEKFSKLKEINRDILKVEDKELMESDNKKSLLIQEKFGIVKIHESLEYYRFTLRGATNAVIKILFYNCFKKNFYRSSKSIFKRRANLGKGTV